MILTSLRLGPFGGIPKLHLAFGRGLNTIVGPNEAGKSTVYRAIVHALFTPTKLRKPEFSRLIAPLLPRPSGDSVFCELEVDVEGVYRIAKRWGSDATSRLVTPAGEEIRDDEAIRNRLRDLMPVREATMRRVLLSPQASLRNTIPELETDTEATDELGEALRRSLFETGGVRIEMFRRRLSEELGSLYSRWDRRRNAPEGGRGIERPWKQGVGTLLSAHYEIARAERELQTAEQIETELTILGARAEELETHLDERRRFIEANEKAADAVHSIQALEAERAAVERELEVAQEDNGKWPVLEARLKDARETLAGLRARAESLGDERRAAEERIAKEERRRRFEAIESRRNELLEAQRRRDGLVPIKMKDVETLSRLERAIDRLEQSFAVGSITVTVDGVSGELRYTVDLRSEETAAADGRSFTIDGHRRIVFAVGELTVTAVAGDVDTEALERQLREARSSRGELRNRLKVDGAAEAAQARAAYEAAVREVDHRRHAYEETLGDDDLEALRRELDEWAAGGDVEPPPRPLDAISADAARVDEQAGSVAKQIEEHRQGLDSLAERYGSHEELVLTMGERAVRRKQLTQQIGEAGSVPPGFASAEEFLAAYRQAADEIVKVKDDLSAVRTQQARLEERLPDESSEEIRTRLERARARLERTRRRGVALERVREASERILSDLDTGTIDRYRDVLGGRIVSVTGGAYREGSAGETGIPTVFRSARGTDLPLELLSAGTRDSIALAVRLAVAELLLEDQTAPLVLDDPLVDLDPDRQVQAAAGIRDFAEKRQLLFFTCHPTQAELFPTANRIQLGSPIDPSR